MYVCNCNGLTERQVKAAIEAGARNWMEVHLHHEVRPQCGKCGMDIADRLKKGDSPCFESSAGLAAMAEAT